MIPLLKLLKRIYPYPIIACCCGHGKYPMTLVARYSFSNQELLSNIEIPRKKRFYKKDKEGYYYIPEVVEDE